MGCCFLILALNDEVMQGFLEKVNLKNEKLAFQDKTHKGPGVENNLVSLRNSKGASS